MFFMPSPFAMRERMGSDRNSQYSATRRGWRHERQTNPAPKRLTKSVVAQRRSSSEVDSAGGGHATRLGAGHVSLRLTSCTPDVGPANFRCWRDGRGIFGRIAVVVGRRSSRRGRSRRWAPLPSRPCVLTQPGEPPRRERRQSGKQPSPQWTPGGLCDRCTPQEAQNRRSAACVVTVMRRCNQSALITRTHR